MHVRFWPLTSFTALQKGGRYRIEQRTNCAVVLDQLRSVDPFETSVSYSTKYAWTHTRPIQVC
jgi:hypothetical protein